MITPSNGENASYAAKDTGLENTVSNGKKNTVAERIISRRNHSVTECEKINNDGMQRHFKNAWRRVQKGRAFTWLETLPEAETHNTLTSGFSRCIIRSDKWEKSEDGNRR